MDHHIRAPHSPVQPRSVPHITDEKPEALIPEPLLHFDLEEFPPGEDPESLRGMVTEDDFGELLAKGSGTSGEQYGLSGQGIVHIRSLVSRIISSWDTPAGEPGPIPSKCLAGGGIFPGLSLNNHGF